MDILFDTIGIIGVATLLIAFFMLEKKKVSSDESLYYILNLIGAILLLISLFHSWNLPSVVIEVFWITISLFGIKRTYKLKGDIDKE